MQQSAVVKRIAAFVAVMMLIGSASSHASASVEAAQGKQDHLMVIVPTFEQYFEAQAHIAIRTMVDDAVQRQLSLESSLEHIDALLHVVKPVAGSDNVVPLAGMSFTERAAQ